ncbi:hypothetical protein [Salmonella phage S124]|uniref:Uncharacterized protein n=1 Tax=Salmonella phage S124 TaxID=2231351 RepID=A0A2Z5HTG4_9CAUD|nr:hypothetical protein HOT67_gp126 [Salmonella phage S124]AXC43157.1 hypothetical protein [Salmonella phage S124]
MKEINLNSYARIPATEPVLEYLRREHTEFWRAYTYEHNSDAAIAFADKRIAEYTDPVITDGFIKMPLWDLMQKFGDTMIMGQVPYFTEIYFDEKDIK